MNPQSFQPTDSNQTYTPSKEQYKEMARDSTLIPVYREVIADTETPVSALLKLGDNRYRFILESVKGGDSLGRYSFIGTDVSYIFRSRGSQVEIGLRKKSARKSTGAPRCKDGFHWTSEKQVNPLHALRRLLHQFKPAAVPGLPRFYGGAVGYLGYDLIRTIHDLPDNQKDVLQLPDAFLIFSDTVLIFDHVRGTLKIVANTQPGEDPEMAYDQSIAQIENVLAQLKDNSHVHPLELTSNQNKLELSSNFNRMQFEDAVRQCQNHLEVGDIDQVVISQRFEVPMCAEPTTLYRVLRTVNPSPYMFYLQLGDAAIVGSSPEVMARIEDGVASVRPIAGTRPRGATDEEDLAFENDLLSDEKERAEHTMLVELGKDDLDQVCMPGTIEVSDSMCIERYSHVMHIVSNVSGRIAEGKDAIDLLETTFPAGTVSGSPRRRAFEIIDEIERERRGPYSGAIGYFGYSGNMDSCITIRTAVISNGVAHVQVGAGIVKQSVPEHEYDETINKAKAMLEAIALAERAI